MAEARAGRSIAASTGVSSSLLADPYLDTQSPRASGSSVSGESLPTGRIDSNCMNSTSQPDSVRISVGIVSDDIDVAALLEEVADHRAGAVDVFVGTVRDHSIGRDSVTHLEYEAYEEEVEDVIGDIALEASQRWALIAIAIRHRIGTLPLGGVAVAVAVSAGHRTEVFDACRYLIDELKSRAPIWKKEHWDDGAEWVLGP